MSNFANYTAISDESHGEFFTNLVSKDFTPIADSPLMSHNFIEAFTMTYVDHDEENRKRVVDYYRTYLTELFLKVEQRAVELVAGVRISDEFFEEVIKKACGLVTKSMSGHPDYAEYLLQAEPEDVLKPGVTFIPIRTSIIIVKGDPDSVDDKEPRLLGMVDSELWQVQKENPTLADRIKFIEQWQIN